MNELSHKKQTQGKERQDGAIIGKPGNLREQFLFVTRYSLPVGRNICYVDASITPHKDIYPFTTLEPREPVVFLSAQALLQFGRYRECAKSCWSEHEGHFWTTE